MTRWALPVRTMSAWLARPAVQCGGGASRKLGTAPDLLLVELVAKADPGRRLVMAGLRLVPVAVEVLDVRVDLGAPFSQRAGPFRVGEQQVDRVPARLVGVRHDRQPLRRGQRHDLAELGDTTGRVRVRLEDRRRAALDDLADLP